MGDAAVEAGVGSGRGNLQPLLPELGRNLQGRGADGIHAFIHSYLPLEKICCPSVLALGDIQTHTERHTCIHAQKDIHANTQVRTYTQETHRNAYTQCHRHIQSYTQTHTNP